MIAPEFAIVTEDGVKVADLAWMSHEVWTQIKTETTVPGGGQGNERNKRLDVAGLGHNGDSPARAIARARRET
ncbi:MAG: hypothetical protein ACRED0_08610 [Gammaproteobacteria bacterium]